MSVNVSELKEVSGWDYLDSEQPNNESLNKDLYLKLKECKARRELFGIGLEVVEGGMGTMKIITNIDEFIITIEGAFGDNIYEVSSSSDALLGMHLEETRKKINGIKSRKKEFEKKFC